jgi:DNA-binding NtrC family response regulator
VNFVNTAHEAYEILEKKPFDLILCDYYLPDTKGEMHIRELAKLAPTIPIIIITGQGDEKIAARSIKAGAEDYIVKTREALAALPSILKRAMTKHQSHQNKKQKEIQRHLKFQKKTVQKVLGEVDAIGKKMKILKKYPHKLKKKSPHSKDSTTLEHLAQRLDSLKNFVKNMFLGGK